MEKCWDTFFLRRDKVQYIRVGVPSDEIAKYIHTTDKSSRGQFTSPHIVLGTDEV